MMRLVLLLLTLSAGAFGGAMYWMSDAEENQLAVVRDVTAGGLARVDVSKNPPQIATAPQASAQSAPTVPAPTDNASSTSAEVDGSDQRFFGGGLATSSTSSRTTEAASGPAALPGTASAAPPAAKSEPWQTDVVLAPRQQPTSSNSSVVLTTGALPAPREMPREALVRDLQRELKRVGCYSGDATGDWNAGSKRALQSFLERVNSTLPTGTPDLIQLTLVRGYSGTACRSGDPSTITARAPTPRGDTARSEPTRSAQSQTQQYQNQPVAVRALPQNAFTQQQAQQQQVQPSQPAALASLPQGQPAQAQPPQSQQQTVASTQPPVVIFEGRMAIGGPATPEAPDSSTSPPITSSAPAGPSPHVARPSKQAAPQRPRRDRAWTANFFNQ